MGRVSEGGHRVQALGLILRVKVQDLSTTAPMHTHQALPTLILRQQQGGTGEEAAPENQIFLVKMWASEIFNCS